jgi:peptidylprolyl isomerase
MRIIDVSIGTGKLAEAGKLMVVHYTGYLRDGTKFDSSRDRNEPFSFEQGKRRVIPGFDNGCEGMRVGGKRRLLIPYQLAYGEKGRTPKIPARSELIFDIELLDVKEPPAAP